MGEIDTQTVERTLNSYPTGAPRGKESRCSSCTLMLAGKPIRSSRPHGEKQGLNGVDAHLPPSSKGGCYAVQKGETWRAPVKPKPTVAVPGRDVGMVNYIIRHAPCDSTLFEYVRGAMLVSGGTIFGTPLPRRCAICRGHHLIVLF